MCEVVSPDHDSVARRVQVWRATLACPHSSVTCPCVSRVLEVVFATEGSVLVLQGLALEWQWTADPQPCHPEVMTWCHCPLEEAMWGRLFLSVSLRRMFVFWLLCSFALSLSVNMLVVWSFHFVHTNSFSGTCGSQHDHPDAHALP